MTGVFLVVTGRVQGVYFRATTQREAKRLGLVGRVCNRPDGSVAIEAYGDSQSISHLVTWCQKGPDGALVKNVTVSPLENPRTFTDFLIESLDF